jgi:hypothetical protein
MSEGGFVYLVDEETFESRRDARDDKGVFRQRQKVMRHLQMHTGPFLSLSVPPLSLLLLLVPTIWLLRLALAKADHSRRALAPVPGRRGRVREQEGREGR